MPSTPLGLCWWKLLDSLVFVALIRITRNLQEKMAKAIAEFIFRRLGKDVYGTKRL
jgi:hypothetical protein